MTEVRVAATAADVALAYRIRADVFVTEQGVPVDLERDEADEQAEHLLAYDGDEPVGAGRLVVEPAGFEGVDPALGPVGHLGRLAVLPGWRGFGVGVALVRAIEDRARARGLGVVALSSQSYAVPFYERLGYTAYGPEFDDAGIPHRWMRRRL